jgi:hypothetical protein
LGLGRLDGPLGDAYAELMVSAATMIVGASDAFGVADKRFHAHRTFLPMKDSFICKMLEMLEFSLGRLAEDLPKHVLNTKQPELSVRSRPTVLCSLMVPVLQ